MRPYRHIIPIFLTVTFILSGLILTGCEKPQETARQAPPPTEVTVITVSPRQIALTTDLPGRTAPFRVAEIRPQVSGLIQKRLFNEGSDVAAGDVLYMIDSASFKAAEDSAKANLLAMKRAADRARASLNVSTSAIARYESTLSLAKSNQKRLGELVKEKAVSVSEYDKAVTETEVAEASLKSALAQVESDRVAVSAAEAAIKQAEAALETAEINLGYTKITAPISGRIGRSNVSEGAIVTAYQATALATIQQMDPIYVDVPQSTSELLKLRRKLESGDLNQNNGGEKKVALLLEDGTKYPLEGSLKFRDVSVEPSTGSVIIRAIFPNPDDILLPGMFVRAVVQEGVNDNAILIPQQSVARDPKGSPIAYSVNDQNIIEQKQLVLERAVGSEWLVSSGLNPGEKIVMEGLLKIRHGVPVNPKPYGQAPGNESAQPRNNPPAKTN